MATKLDYSNPKLDLTEIVFEDRNKAYGAYYHRRTQNYRMLYGFIISLVAFGLVLGVPRLVELLAPEEEIVVEEPIDISVELQDFDPPPVDPKTPPPPPDIPATPPPPAVTTVRFVPPEVAPAEEPIVEDPPKQEDFKEVAVGDKSQEGDPGANPDDLIVNPGVVGGTGTGQPVKVEEEIFEAVEESPQFPGGYAEMQKYLQKNLKYPNQARNAEIQGQVFVRVVVNSNGELTDPVVVKGVGFGLDEEAIRLVKLMPNWTPGKQNGRAVRVKQIIPIRFRLAG